MTSRKRPVRRQHDMLHQSPDALQSIEHALRAQAASDAAVWERMRRTLAQRATAAGVVDVAFERHDSPLGTILLGATASGVVRVGLPLEDDAAVLDELATRVSARVLQAPRPVLARARRQLDEYFAGRRQRFELALDWQLTAGFRRDVLRATARIPYGRTSSYRDVAIAAGSPRAFRAAGSALATNPLPIVVPCHRVLPSGGGTGAYRGGSAAKVQLLDLERGR